MKHLNFIVNRISTNTPPCCSKRASRFVWALVLMLTIGIGQMWGETLTCTFESVTGKSFPYNDAWTLTNGSENTTYYHGGSRCLQFSTTTAEIIRTTNKINGTITNVTFYAGRTSKNNTSTNVYIQTSTDGSTWTTRKTFDIATAGRLDNSNNNWTTVSQDLTDVSNCYVRISRAGASTAVRAIDDITITYTPAASCEISPGVGNSSSSSINVTGGTVSCTGITKGDCDIDEWGFVYGTATGPTSNVQKISSSKSTTNVSSFNKTLTGLDPNTKYYVRAYANVGSSTFYGAETNFTTKTITASSSSTTYGTVSRSKMVITGSPKSGCQYASPAYTISGSTPADATTVSQNGNTFTVTSTSTTNVTVTINFEAIPTYTVSFSAGIGNPAQEDISEANGGSGVTLPDGPTPKCSADGWVFAGWKETSAVTSETTTVPTLLSAGSTFHPSGDVTLYAVYKKGDGKYHLVTTLPTGEDIPGNYMVVNTSAAKAMDVDTKSTYYLDADATGTITSNAITPANVTYFNYNHWKVTYESSKWIFYNETRGKYLYNYCNDGSHHNVGNTSSKPSGYTLSLSSGYVIFNSADDAGAGIFYDASHTDFAGTTTAYTTAASGLHLYKEEPITYFSNPFCCTELASINGSVSLSQKSATLNWSLQNAQNGGLEHITSWKVEYMKDGDADWSVAESTLAKATTTKTISDLDCNSDYSFRVSANVDNGYCAEAYEVSDKKTTQYTITLTGSGSVSGGTFEADETSACDGATITLDATKSTGYNFSTWTISDGSDDITADVLGEGFAATDAIIEITMPEKNIIVTAAFAAQHHNVVFHKNDGGEDETSNQDFTYGVAQNLNTISTIAWSRANYNFGGWMTDAEGEEANYVDGASYTLNSESNVNLYALWVASNTRTISYSGESHITYSPAKPTTVDIENDDEFSVSFSLDAHYSLNGVVVTMGNTPLDESLISFDQESLTVTAPQGGFTDNISVTYTIVQTTYTVNFYINNDLQAYSTQSGVYGTELTVPSGDDLNISDCSDASLSFVGWTESAIGSTPAQSKPTYAEIGSTITANKNYYAVFAAGEAGSTNWTKATSIADGDYLIVTQGVDANSAAFSRAFDGSLSTLDATSNYKDVTISDGVLSLTNADNYVFTFAAITGGYSIKSKSGYYIGQTGTKNGLATSGTSDYVNSVDFDESDNVIITCNTSYTLQYNKAVDQKRFRYFSGAQTPIQLYKKTTTPDSYNSWVTVCPHCNTVTLEKVYGTNPANGSITLKQGNTEVSAPVETCEGDVTINVTNSPSLGYQLSTLTVSGIEGASVNAAKTQITIPQDGDGTLTVTATFVASPSITVTDGVDPVTDLNFGTPKKAAAVPAAKTFVITGANLTNALTVESSNTTLYAVSYGEGVLTPTAGAVSATITVTPQEGITTSAGEKNANITISGGGLANDVVIPASMTVQETYTVKWWINNNTETPSATQTDVIDTDLEVPSVTPTGDCSELVFKGWLTAPLAETSATAPVGLITPEEIATMKIAGNANYYAVFATETPGDPTTDTWELTDGDLVIKDNNQSSGYDKYAGEQEKDNIRFQIANIMPNNSAIQFKASSGMMYNTDEMPGDIISIAINGLDLDVYEGTVAISSTPSSGKITKDNSVYPFTSGKRYFHIKKSTNSAGSTTSITVTYHSVTASTFSNYVTTCPHCNSVALEAAYGTNPANGSITLGKSEVKTCETATVTIENTPDTGYELSAIALSNNITGASVNDAMTQITIPEGAPAGTLTVTATFAAIDYAVTMTQTGGANADLTGAKDDAHYGETINITAEDKDGYQFLGWEASPEVAFANASALSTSFTMPNEAVEVTAKYAKICTVKFYVGTSESAYATQTPHAGETVDLSSVATPSSFDATNYPNFIGWSATNFGAAVVEPALITGSEIINDDANYYAVFGNALTVETNNYAKVTAIESGKNYLVVAEASDKFYAMKNTVVSSYYIGSDEVAPVSNVITSDAAHKWQIAIPATGKMTIQNASAGYVYMYPGTGNYKDLGLQEEAYQFSYTLTEGKVQLEGISSTYVQFTSNYKNFAAKDEASDLYLYKQIVNPTKWATKQIEEVTVSFNDNVAEEEITVPANEVVESGSDLDLSGFTPGARAGYQFSGWSLTTNGAVVSSLSNITENTPLYAIWAINHKTTIKFYAKGSDDPIATHDQTQGLAYDIPDLSASLPAVPQGFTFVGWSASQINNEVAAYTQVTSVTPDVAEADNEMSLYAVYNREVTGSGDYIKVTTARADWSGQYLIVNEASEVALNGNINSTSYDVVHNTVSVSISESTIVQSAAMDNASFTFAPVTGGYSIRSHSGYYIGRTSSSTGINATDEYNASYVNTPDVNSITAGNDYLLRYNAASDQDRFRYYSGESVKGIALYRKDDVENNYTTNPVVKYDITYLAGEAENVTGVCDADRQEAGNITLCDAPTCADKDFQGWNDGSQTYAAGAEYPLSADVTFTATWTDKPTYNVTYNTSGSQGTTPTDATNYYEGDPVTLASASGLSNAGYFFDQWVATYVDNNSETQTLDIEDNKFTMPAFDVTVTATWARKSSDKWIKVTATSQLAADKEYVIASTVAYPTDTEPKSYYAISTTQNSNNRKATPVDVNDGILIGSEAMETFVLEDADNNMFALKAKSSNLYLCTATGGNYLRSQAVIDANSSWTITIEDGVASIVATNSTYRNVMQFNYASNNQLFACYSEANQKAVAIYYKAPKIDINNGQTVNVSDAEGADIVVHNGGTLNVDAAKSVGDLTVENGGEVVLDANKLTVVGTFTIETTMASGKSGQMKGATSTNFATTGEAYIDITLGDNGNPEKWHAFTVPFPVDAINGIYDLDGNKLTNEVNYAIMDYHGDIRATGAYGWKKYRKTLVPGTFYLMTVDGLRTTYRFKKTADGALVAGNTKDLEEYPLNGGTEEHNDNGWNGVGNPTLRYGQVAYKVQVLNPTSYTYEPFEANETNFVVGTPFFIQADAVAAAADMTFGVASGEANYAPARTPAKGIESVKVTFGNEEYKDRLYISSSEDALNRYETGNDLAKMTMTSTPKVAQIFGKAYNSKLCMVYAPMVNDQAEVALELYAPQAGEYTIAAPAMENANLYLTYEGAIIWNLSMGEYELDLNKGTTNGYGLLLQAKAPSVATGVEEVQSDKVQCTKVVIDDHVYILRGGQMYDVTGKMVK